MTTTAAYGLKLESLVEARDSKEIATTLQAITTQSDAIYLGLNLGYQLIDDKELLDEVLGAFGIYRAVVVSIKDAVERIQSDSNQAVVKSLKALPSATHTVWAVLYLVEILAKSKGGIKRISQMSAIALK